MEKIIIAIDGYSSCGKSTTAKGVAASLGYAYIDTGAMYRAVTLYFHEKHISLTDPSDIEKALSEINIEFRRNKFGENQVHLNGLNVENEIRKLYVANKVSDVSAIAAVRVALVDQQRKMGQKRGVVMDGRDIASVVFPDAELKVFMTADSTIRAQRRQIELMAKGEMISFEEIIANIEKRDKIDTTRKESPLIQVEDAEIVDTSHMTLDEQIEMVTIMAELTMSKRKS
ncbi:(d)CMP kinase [Arcticibacterium luteifluviistationis]|uniref:Cytidylate kinase n=1 Tax=Arcticibacterium luteifluviistationis TaxID=1784714 RepID=A0A2Z4GAP9_9BACT|nr:(d)CMP kinase [Arcticibacterium luteifluviistationis]AWV98155.1 (d)CMP kinase [Arcticibacterium luteifluviistationis]